jgi:hypothetical protein
MNTVTVSCILKSIFVVLMVILGLGHSIATYVFCEIAYPCSTKILLDLEEYEEDKILSLFYLVNKDD